MNRHYFRALCSPFRMVFAYFPGCRNHRTMHGVSLCTHFDFTGSLSPFVFFLRTFDPVWQFFTHHSILIDFLSQTNSHEHHANLLNSGHLDHTSTSAATIQPNPPSAICTVGVSKRWALLNVTHKPPDQNLSPFSPSCLKYSLPWAV